MGQSVEDNGSCGNIAKEQGRCGESRVQRKGWGVASTAWAKMADSGRNNGGGLGLKGVLVIPGGSRKRREAH